MTAIKKEIEGAAKLRSVLVTRATTAKQQRQQPILSLKQISQRLAMSQSLHTVGIISIGEIGFGIGLLLIGHSHRVFRYAVARKYNQCLLIVFITR